MQWRRNGAAKRFARPRQSTGCSRANKNRSRAGRPPQSAVAREFMNTYDQLKEAVRLGVIPKEKAVAVSYCPCPSGRMGMADFDKTRVWSPFFKTDPEAHWSDHGSKTFSGNRTRSLPRALEWATKEYGIEEWSGNAMRDKVPAVVHEKVRMSQP